MSVSQKSQLGDSPCTPQVHRHLPRLSGIWTGNEQHRAHHTDSQRRPSHLAFLHACQRLPHRWSCCTTPSLLLILADTCCSQAQWRFWTAGYAVRMIQSSCPPWQAPAREYMVSMCHCEAGKLACDRTQADADLGNSLLLLKLNERKSHG